jgi:hypothetical protein
MFYTDLIRETKKVFINQGGYRKKEFTEFVRLNLKYFVFGHKVKLFFFANTLKVFIIKIIFTTNNISTKITRISRKRKL